MNSDSRLEQTISLKDLISLMKDEGLVWAKESDLKKDRLKERYLRKNNLTYKQISDAELWGEIGKDAVVLIAKKELLDHEVFKKGNSYRIHRSAVERIGKNRGTI